MISAFAKHSQESLASSSGQGAPATLPPSPHCPGTQVHQAILLLLSYAYARRVLLISFSYELANRELSLGYVTVGPTACESIPFENFAQ